MSTVAPGPPSLELLSPDAANKMQPLAVAASAALSTCSAAAASQPSSSAPQLIDRTSQPAATASLITCVNEPPAFGAKKTLIVGIWPVQKKYTAAATWISSRTSPSASPPGLLDPPSTDTSVGRI